LTEIAYEAYETAGLEENAGRRSAE